MVSPAQQAALDQYLAELERYKQFEPERLQAPEVGETALAGLQYDPRMLEYEMSALRALEEQGREGLTAQDRAAMAEAERQASQAARGRRGAIQQSMQQRGISGSGLDLVAQLQSAEAANELAAMRALEQGAISAQRRSQGQQAAGQQAARIGERQLETQAQRAAAQDRIRAFNAQNRARAQEFNIGMGAETARQRLGAGQQAAQFQYNVEADRLQREQIEKERKRRQRQGALSAGLGALGGAAGAYFGGPAGAGAGFQIGSALGGAFAQGGRVPGVPTLDGDSPINDNMPILASPGEMVLPRTASESPDAAAAYVQGYTKAERDVEKAKSMRDILGYADIATKALSDYSASRAQPIALPGRFEDIGKAPQMLERPVSQYQMGALSQLGELGVKRAQEGLGAAKEKFAMDTGLEKYKAQKQYDDPNSDVSKRANLLLKSKLASVKATAKSLGDNETARIIDQFSANVQMSANEAMQAMKQIENIEYKDLVGALKSRQEEVGKKALTDAQIKKLEAETNKLLTEGKVGKVGTAEQFKSATFGTRIAQAEKEFEEIQKAGFDPTATAERLRSILPAEQQSALSQRQEQAERNFLTAILRRESGAAIGKDEYAMAREQYFPRPGDKPEVIRQKARNRAIALTGLRAESGPAWQAVQDLWQAESEKLTKSEDEKALEWARQNPDDPMAANILKKLGLSDGTK